MSVIVGRFFDPNIEEAGDEHVAGYIVEALLGDFSCSEHYHGAKNSRQLKLKSNGRVVATVVYGNITRYLDCLTLAVTLDESFLEEYRNTLLARVARRWGHDVYSYALFCSGERSTPGEDYEYVRHCAERLAEIIK